MGFPQIFDKALLKDLTLASVPVILQQSFVSVGNFFINRRINLIGEDATTGFTTAFKLISMANMGVISMTNGLSNFALQNKAAGEYSRVKKGFVAVLCYALVTSLLFFIVSCFLPVVCVKIVSDGTVRGTGNNIGFTVNTFSDLILRVALVYILTSKLNSK